MGWRKPTMATLQDSGQRAHGSKFGSWLTAAGISLAGIFVAGLVVYLVHAERGFKLRLDKSGVDIDVQANETFGQLLTKALEKNRTEVDAILASHQYYNLANADFVDRLGYLDASKPETKEISNRLRKLLWDLRGPFEIPFTLSGADERMSKALDALEAARQERKEANALLVELWKQSLQGEGIFWPRSFGATVEVVHGTQTKKILACPGDAIVTVSGIIMSLSLEGGADAISAEIEQNPSLFHCDRSPLTAEKLLADGGTPRLGVSESTFRSLVPTSVSNQEGKVGATFRLYPKYMTGIGVQ